MYDIKWRINQNFHKYLHNMYLFIIYVKNVFITSYVKLNKYLPIYLEIHEIIC